MRIVFFFKTLATVGIIFFLCILCLPSTILQNAFFPICSIIIILFCIYLFARVLFIRKSNTKDKLLKSDEFYWRFAYNAFSPNTKFKLSWTEWDNLLTIKLEFNGQKLWEKQLTKFSVSGIVTDEGVSALFCCCYEEQTTRLYFFRSDGERILQQFFERCTNQIGLSSLQNIVWLCQTRNRTREESEDKLVVYFLDKLNKPWVISDPRGKCYIMREINNINKLENQIAIRENNDIYALCDKKGNIFNYEYLNEQYQLSRENSTNGYMLYNLACEYMTNCPILTMPHDKQVKTIDLLVRANRGKISDNTHAHICKILGEYCYAIEDLNNTIAWFEQALDWNPKIGLKRKLTELKKQLAAKK